MFIAFRFQAIHARKSLLPLLEAGFILRSQIPINELTGGVS